MTLPSIYPIRDVDVKSRGAVYITDRYDGNKTET